MVDHRGKNVKQLRGCFFRLVKSTSPLPVTEAPVRGAQAVPEDRTRCVSRWQPGGGGVGGGGAGLW